MSAVLAPVLAAGGHPAIVPRLVVPEALAGQLTLDEERELGTYGPACSDDLIAELELAGLRGRGGGAFPAHRKWRAVAAAPGPRVVVANGEEGEPASAKDQWLLVHRPHLVLDGVFRAAAAVGAARAVIYLAHPATVEAVEAAIAELPSTPRGLRLDLHVVEPSYVAGEETAACRAIDGGPALPVAKPPRPFEQGVGGRPTLVANVETLAHAAWIGRHGAAAYRVYGNERSPGTTLVTLGGACRRPGVYEVPFGETFGDLFAAVAGGFSAPPAALVMGGWFGGLLATARLGVACCYDAVRDAGSGLGCGAVTVLGGDAEPLAEAAEIAAWFAEQSARQCGVCIRGTAAIRDTLASLAAGTAPPSAVDDLRRWGATLPGRGACGLLDGAAALARTAVRELDTSSEKGVTE